MKRLKSFWSMVIALTITIFSAQAQDDVASKIGAELGINAPVAVKAANGVQMSASAQYARSLEVFNNYKAKESEIALKSSESAAKKAPRKVASVNELAGTYVLTATSLLSSGYNGLSVTVAPLGSDSITIADFWASGFNSIVKAKVDVATGKITIPSQVMAQDATYGDILLAATNLSDGQPITTQDIEGTVNADGTLSLSTAWGAYVKASATATSWSYYAIVAATVLEKANAVFSGLSHYSGTTESYGVVVNQAAANVVRVKNLGNYGQTVTMKLNRDTTANLPTSLIAYNSTYGDFYCYGITFTETGASLSSADIVTDVATDLKKLSWANWGVITGANQGSRYIVSAYDKCEIACATDISYPKLDVTEFDGEGTEANPYLIKSLNDLVLLSDKVAEMEYTYPVYAQAYKGKYFRVENDIDMSGYVFDPIANDGMHRFAGVLDGNNHTISNLVVERKANFNGLFGCTDTMAVVKNLVIDGATITNNSTGWCTAVVAGWSYGSVSNVTVKNATIYSAGSAVGSIAGISNSPITNCVAESVQISGLGGYTGGLVGEAHADVTDCHSYKVKIVSAGGSGSSNPGFPAGGVVGYQIYSTMENCWFSGTLDGYSMLSEYQTLGGVAGWATSATVKNCFAVGQISTYSAGSASGGVVGYLRGTLENAFFNGVISSMSTRSSGGAVGRLMTFTEQDGTVVVPTMKNVYASASISSETYQYQTQANEQNNEIIGTIMAGVEPSLTNVYFDKQVVNITNSRFGVPTTTLTAAAGPAGFDASVWSFKEGYYPALKAFESTDASKLATAAIVQPVGPSFDMFSKDADINYESGVVAGFYKAGSLNKAGYFAGLDDSLHKIVLNSENQFGNDTIFFVNNAANYYRVIKVAPVPFEGGGTAEEPFLLKTKADLILLSQLTTEVKQLFPGVYFKIVNDIDLEYDEAFLGICSNAPDAHNIFSGVIDGDGHFIHRIKAHGVDWKLSPADAGTAWPQLNTSSSVSYKGFVGRLGADGVVKNVNIANDCDFEFYGISGAVVGLNDGLVENCRNYSNVTGYSCWIGGISGQNTKNGTIRNCYNEGEILGGYAWTGGIVGASYSLVENCMNVGTITVRQLSTSYTNQLHSAGGIAGASTSGAKYVNCVNAGTISATAKRVGGIVGAWGAVSATSTTSNYRNDMVNCVNYGAVFTADAATMGAMAGGEAQSTSEDISNNYWDVQILDIPAECNKDNENMNGVETSVLTSGSPLKDFDTEIWKFEAGKYPVLKAFADEPRVALAAETQLQIPTGVTNKNLSADAVVKVGVPTLKDGTKFVLDGMTVKGIPTTSEVVTDELTITNGAFVKVIGLSAMPNNPLQGAGTESDPWQLTSADEWNALATFISATANSLSGEYLKLMNDIDFTGKQITPLGSDGVTSFAGILDGNGKKVTGYDFVTTKNYQGALFGVIAAEGVVKNLTAAGSVTAGSKMNNLAGVVGDLYGRLENVKNEGNVTNTTTSYTCGVAARAFQGSQLIGCVNDGDVTSASTYLAGIVGYVYEGVELVNCVNNGKVATSSTANATYVGGIASYALPASFVNCVNNGEIVGGTAAGIVSYCFGKADVGAYTFDHCVNTGNITGAATLAGIAALQGATVGNNVCHYIECVNEGDITATAASAVSSSSLAGIAAYHTPGSKFYRCVNKGNIANNKSVYTAGIAGYYKGSANATYPVEFVGCENYGKISAVAGQQIAGIVAYVSNYATIDSCYNYGAIEQGTWGAAGICYTFTGNYSVLRNCVNMGDVTVGTYLAGGVVGNNANNQSVLENCVNTGTISTNGSGTTAYGIGGIAGCSYTAVTNCINMGEVRGNTRTGGIVGQPSYYASAVRTRLVNCVNIGKVTGATGAAGALVGTEPGKESTYWGESNYVANGYYVIDMDSVGDFNNVGTAVTVAELTAIDMNNSGETQEAPAANEEGATAAWMQYDAYSIPVPVTCANFDAVKVAAAAVVVSEPDTLPNVTAQHFHLGVPEGVTWTVSAPDTVAVNGNDAKVLVVTSDQEVVLTATCGDLSREWTLLLNVDVLSSIDDVNADANVIGEMYFDITGVNVAKPQKGDGKIYIVVLKYADGSTKALKLLNR